MGWNSEKNLTSGDVVSFRLTGDSNDLRQKSYHGRFPTNTDLTGKVVRCERVDYSGGYQVCVEISHDAQGNKLIDWVDIARLTKVTKDSQPSVHWCDRRGDFNVGQQIQVLVNPTCSTLTTSAGNELKKDIIHNCEIIKLEPAHYPNSWQIRVKSIDSGLIDWINVSQVHSIPPKGESPMSQEPTSIEYSCNWYNRCDDFKVGQMIKILVNQAQAVIKNSCSFNAKADQIVEGKIVKLEPPHYTNKWQIQIHIESTNQYDWINVSQVYVAPLSPQVEPPKLPPAMDPNDCITEEMLMQKPKLTEWSQRHAEFKVGQEIIVQMVYLEGLKSSSSGDAFKAGSCFRAIIKRLESASYSAHYQLLIEHKTTGQQDWINIRHVHGIVHHHNVTAPPVPPAVLTETAYVPPTVIKADIQLPTKKVQSIMTTQTVVQSVTEQFKQAAVINAKITAGKGAIAITANMIKTQLPEDLHKYVDHPVFGSVLAALVVALQSQFLAANPKAQLVSESVCLAGVNNISSMLKLEEMVNNLFKQFEPLLEQIPQE